MIRATTKDKTKAIAIINETFDANPSVNIVIGAGGNRSKKISRLASYAFIKALNKKGAYLSTNKMGITLCFSSDNNSFSLKEFISELRFAFSIPVKKVLETLKRESYIKKNRYKGKHLYFWFFGVTKGGNRAAFELKNNIFDYSHKEQLPLLLETSVQRNKDIYERYGFYVYHEWKDSGGGHTLWFMMRDVK